MKNYKDIIIIGLVAILLIAATSDSFMTIKPAMPKSVVSVVVDAEQSGNTILKYSREGYILKETWILNPIANTNYVRTLIVMEKY